MQKISWCLENNIKIYCNPTSKGRKPFVNIYINYQSKIKKGTEIYAQNKVHLKIYELYEHIYNKLN